MRARWAWALPVIAALGIGAAFLLPGVRQTPVDLSIAFTCDVNGRLVPCGCFTGQMGGLTRVATFLRESVPADALKLDVGDAIEGTADYQQIEHRYLLRAFAQLGYAAVNLGHREAGLSAAALRDLKKGAPLPILSANLLEQSTGMPLFEPTRIVTRGRWKIGLVGVLDPRIPPEALGEGVAIERMETALARVIPELKKRADLIVLLAFTDETSLAALAREFYEVDVILGGKVSQPSQQLIRENRSQILYTTNQSRAVGLMSLTLDPHAPLQAKAGEIILMHDRIPEDASIQSLATAYRDEVRKAKLAIDDPAAVQSNTVPGVKSAAFYVGTESCVGCHATAGESWRKSSHAHAFATLVEQKADADPNCIGCHTVGFGNPGGYLRAFGTTRLTDVGCESCHGPGSQHVAQRARGGAVTARFRKLGAGDCQKCHYGEFSRPFVWDDFWTRIQHGKEPTAATVQSSR